MQCRRGRFDPWVGKILWRREWPHSRFLPGEFHGRRSLASYSPWGCKELDMTDWTFILFSFYFVVFSFKIKLYISACFFGHINFYWAYSCCINIGKNKLLLMGICSISFVFVSLADSVENIFVCL